MKRLEDISPRDLSLLYRLYSGNPILHTYLLYDILYMVDLIDLCYEVSGGELTAYVLYWAGLPGARPSIHIYGWRPWTPHCVRGLLEDLASPPLVQLLSPRLLPLATELLESLGYKYTVEWFIDMAYTGSEPPEAPVGTERVVRLGPQHSRDFAALKEEQGVGLGEDEAGLVLGKLLYYGVFAEGRLVAFLGRCAFAERSWALCDLYVAESWRRRGYGRLLVSYATWAALAAGATPFLHVSEENRVAVRLYEEVGYEKIARRPWLTPVGRASS